MMSSPVKGNSTTGRKRKMHRIPSTSTWRDKIAARKESIKEDIGNAFGQKRRKSSTSGKVSAVQMANKREKVISEIFSSEKTYQEQLSMIIEHFMIPLQKLGLLPDPDQKVIFENVKSIQAVNKELLQHMEERGIPQAFIQLAPFFKVYCTYANNFEKSMQTLQDWGRKRADVGHFLRQQESKLESGSLNLDALLITPIQRIPRYRLLLKELLDNTPEDHEDYEQLKETVTAINQVTSGINEYIREHENFQKMLIIQNCLTGANAPKILAPGRRFIKEGLLMKVSKKGKGSHERMFFLFNDMLVYAKPNLLDHSHMSRSFVCRRIICLDRCEVQLVLGEQKVEGAGALFKIIFDGEYLLLYSTDNNVALSWINALQDAILQLKEIHVDRRRTCNPSSRRNRRLSSSGGRIGRRRSVLRSTITLRNRRAYPENENTNSKNPRDSLYPMRNQILRRKLGTPGYTPPAKKVVRRRSQRLEKTPILSPTGTQCMESDPFDAPSTSTSQSHVPNTISTQNKSTETNIKIPVGKPLYGPLDGGSNDALNGYNDQDLSFCTLI